MMKKFAGVLKRTSIMFTGEVHNKFYFALSCTLKRENTFDERNDFALFDLELFKVNGFRVL